MNTEHPNDIRAALKEIIEGRNVKRSRHDLRIEAADLTPLFLEMLHELHYLPATVSDTPVSPGERAPAFYIVDGVAHFGWVFWEKFTERKLRKLFGTVVKNRKGDWAIQIPGHEPTTIYVNSDARIAMELDNPSRF